MGPDCSAHAWKVLQFIYLRTDNCVKNHMYSKLRKAIRKLNKTISREFKKEFKEIRQTVLYKIIEATDIAVRNFGGKFGKTTVQVDANGQVVREHGVG